MSRETDTLIIQRVKCRYITPNKPHSGVAEVYPIRIGVDSIDVTCKQCGNEWRATSGILPRSTGFHEVIGQLLLLCSECSMQHVIPAGVICNYSDLASWRRNGARRNVMGGGIAT